MMPDELRELREVPNSRSAEECPQSGAANCEARITFEMAARSRP